MIKLKNASLPKGCITAVKRCVGSAKVDSWLSGVSDLNDLEQKIFKKILSCDITNDGQLEEIYHCINIWGGKSAARFLYNKNYPGFNVEEYRTLVNVCLSLKPSSVSSFAKSIKCPFCGLNVSYLTKHIRFWTYRSLHNNALPIYDGIMAKNYMGKSKTNWKDVQDYWDRLLGDASGKGLSALDYERQLFNSYQSDNEQFNRQ